MLRPTWTRALLRKRPAREIDATPAQASGHRSGRSLVDWTSGCFDRQDRPLRNALARHRDLVDRRDLHAFDLALDHDLVSGVVFELG